MSGSKEAVGKLAITVESFGVAIWRKNQNSIEAIAKWSFEMALIGQ